MSQVERMNNLFSKCPICKSTEGYEPSIFYPLVACKSCKSEWAVYDYGMELKSTSETGFVRELLNKKYSFDFWKGELKPQITGRIFAPMSCIGGTAEHTKPSKGYIILKSENALLYVGEDKEHNKVEIEIPIRRLKKAGIEDRKKMALAVTLLLSPVGAMAVDRNALVIDYLDSFGVEQRRIFDFHAEEKSTKQLVGLLSHLKQKTTLEEQVDKESEAQPAKQQETEQGETRFFCRYCGAENKSDAVFCEKCGKKLK